MIDLRPIGYIVGLMIAVLGVLMLIPAMVDWLAGTGDAWVFAELRRHHLQRRGGDGAGEPQCGGRAAGHPSGLSSDLAIWTLIPLFGALPFMLGATEARFIDAYFEAVSGITTTGATVIVGLDDAARGDQPVAGDAELAGRAGHRLHRDDLPAGDAGGRDAVLPHRRASTRWARCCRARPTSR